MNETLLVVEDEPALRQLLATALAREGYRVHQARNGAEAQDVFTREGASIDLVITDMQMPQVDGARLIDLLRQRRRSLKVLCISGARSAPEGADGFLAKPFSREALLARVRELLSR